MSQKNLPDIFALLPEGYQRIGMLGTLEQMFASGEWGWIEETFPALLEVDKDASFKAKVMSLGVRVALRLRNYELALERQRLFLDLERGSEIILLQAETLMQLAIQMLPAMTDNLYRLWVKSLSHDMPVPAQEIAAKTGVLLADAFIKNQKLGMAAHIKDSMAKKLAEKVWRTASQRI